MAEKRQKKKKDGNQVGVCGMQGDAFLVPDGKAQDRQPGGSDERNNGRTQT